MNPRTAAPHASPARPARIECAIDAPARRRRAASPSSAIRTRSTAARWTTRSCRRWRAPSCSSAAARVRFNFRGVGGSAGAWDEGRGEVDDALAVIAAARATPAQPLALAGFSFGGYVAVAGRRAAAPSDAAERLVLVGAGDAAASTSPPVPADTLVIHGEADDVVPLAATLDWARPQALPVIVVPGAGHFFHGQLPLLKSLVVAPGASPATSVLA